MVWRLRWQALALGILAVTVCVAVGLTMWSKATRLTAAQEQYAAQSPLVTVDAGHGDFDGGAVAADGTEEKDLNLAVALPLSDMLRLCGCRVAMTRTDDTTLCADDSASIRERKVSDMKARLAMYEQADINISIHQNMFSKAIYHGAQMFYSTNDPASRVLAEAVREQIVTGLQPDNTRELKSGNRDIYLLYKTTRPTVLVECGFLSNAEELAALKTPTYQRRLAFAVASGMMRYWCEREETVA